MCVCAGSRTALVDAKFIKKGEQLFRRNSANNVCWGKVMQEGGSPPFARDIFCEQPEQERAKLWPSISGVFLLLLPPVPHTPYSRVFDTGAGEIWFFSVHFLLLLPCQRLVGGRRYPSAALRTWSPALCRGKWRLMGCLVCLIVQVLLHGQDAGWEWSPHTLVEAAISIN